MEEEIVTAKWINKTEFGFQCPNCWSMYKKNGEPYKNSKRIEHRHGSGGNLNNRIEHRSSHCSSISKRICKSFIILITPATIRK